MVAILQSLVTEWMMELNGARTNVPRKGTLATPLRHANSRGLNTGDHGSKRAALTHRANDDLVAKGSVGESGLPGNTPSTNLACKHAMAHLVKVLGLERFRTTGAAPRDNRERGMEKRCI